MSFTIFTFFFFYSLSISLVMHGLIYFYFLSCLHDIPINFFLTCNVSSRPFSIFLRFVFFSFFFQEFRKFFSWSLKNVWIGLTLQILLWHHKAAWLYCSQLTKIHKYNQSFFKSKTLLLWGRFCISKRNAFRSESNANISTDNDSENKLSWMDPTKTLSTATLHAIYSTQIGMFLKKKSHTSTIQIIQNFLKRIQLEMSIHIF